MYFLTYSWELRSRIIVFPILYGEPQKQQHIIHRKSVSSYRLVSSLTVNLLEVLPLTTEIPLRRLTHFRTNTHLMITDLLGFCTFFLLL